MIKRPRIYISAAHKSSGKTTLSIGLMAALHGLGHKVYPFKKGPDYIDPMWLARASERPCYNLDFNTQDGAEIEQLFARCSSDDGISIIEGNKGLYDGVDLYGSDSNAALAKRIDAPVILVLDASGITRGIAPLVLGYQAFDREVNIAGVILNKVGSARVEDKLRSVLEEYTDVPVLGAVGRDDALSVRERHLGLTPPEEFGELDAIIDRLRIKVEASVDLGAVVAVAGDASPLNIEPPAPEIVSSEERVRIGVARDAAFGFYYRDDLQALEQAGAELVFFNALEDKQLPDVDGLFMGGGFPETQMAELSVNKSLMADIAKAAKQGMPIYAECGGLMYLTRSITWGETRFDMVGVIEADTVMHAKPQGRGLVILERTQNHPWLFAGDEVAEPKPGADGLAALAAHEFHYAGLENISSDLNYAYRVLRGSGIDGAYDGIVVNNVLANFAHLRQTSRLKWASEYVAFVRAKMNDNSDE